MSLFCLEDGLIQNEILSQRALNSKQPTKPSFSDYSLSFDTFLLGEYNYSRTSMARTLKARLPRLFRTRS